MCGIVGVISSPGFSANNLALVDTMSLALAHRGPDSSGSWINDDGTICFGHRRLSIQDLSSAGHQPMVSSSGRYVITFNGEIYNFRELADELSAQGVNFVGHSDTEVVLAAVEQWGFEAALNMFSGMFAFAIFDRAEMRVLFARDRMGEKPLYLHASRGRIIFSSELKSLQIGFQSPLKLDKKAIESYFRFGYFSRNRTPFYSVRKLSPASYLSVDIASLKNMCDMSINDLMSAEIEYWNEAVSDDARTVKMEEASELTVESLLRDSVAKQLVADVDVGVFLSGGIDSSVVASLAQTVRTDRIKTFTVAFDHGTYNEASFAKAIAKHIGSEHIEIALGSGDCLAAVETLAPILDEPFADASFIPSLLVAREARKHVKVCLSGDGGDELFAGYNRYHKGASSAKWIFRVPYFGRVFISWLLLATPVIIFDKLHAPISLFFKNRTLRVSDKDVGGKVHKFARILRSRSKSSLYTSLMSFWHEPPLLWNSGLEWAEATDFLCLDEPGSDFITSAMKVDRACYLVSDNLFKVDRASMAHSLEVRLPLLDHRLVSFAATISANKQLEGGTAKSVLRKILYKYVPRDLLERPKMGFSMPIADWLRSDLKDWAETLLSDHESMREAGINRDLVARYWSEHLRCKKDHANSLWAVFMYMLWFAHNRKYIAIES